MLYVDVMNSMSYDEEDDVLFYDEVVSFTQDIMNGNSEWDVEGQNVGWKNTGGSASVSYSDAGQLLDDVTPNSSFNLKVTDLGGGAFEVWISHHDSPTGETHTFYPA